MCACVRGCVCTLSNQHPTCYGKDILLLKSSSLFGFAFTVFNLLTGQRHRWQFCICITNQLLDIYICIFFFKQLFETTTGILSTISWKFVIVCLRYNWLYSIVLTFQTALSTFILMTHLCIDLPFQNACCERHGYPVCLMWKENVFCFVKELSSIVVNTWTEVAELKKKLIYYYNDLIY